MKIKWKVIQKNQYIRAEFGFIVMRCFGMKKRSYNTIVWEADISCKEISHTLRYTSRYLPLRKAKRNAERIAKEMLMDYYVALISEMKQFDLLE